MLYRDTVHKIGNTIKDSRGHVLYPIGNINIVDGQEIWTDGKVIFGNQTGGYNATFNPQSGVMPICLMSGRESYSPHVARVEDYNNMPLEIDKKYFVGFVSNGTHSYGARWYYYPNGMLRKQWFDLNTGECLGIFDAMDACVDDNGDLLTINVVPSNWAGKTPDPDVKYIFRVFFIPERNVGFTGMIWHVRGGAEARFFPEVRAIQTGESKTPGYIEIRKNGRVIKKVSIDKYTEHAKNEVAAKVKSFQNAGDASGETVKDTSGVSAANKLYRQPAAHVETAYTNVNLAHINTDGSWYALLESRARGVAYPWFSWTGTNPYFSYKAHDEYITDDARRRYSGLVGNLDLVFQHAIGTSVWRCWCTPDHGPDKRFKMYLHGSVEYTGTRIIDSSGRDTLTWDLLRAYLDDGEISGRAGMKSPTVKSTFKILPGMDFVGFRQTFKDSKGKYLSYWGPCGYYVNRGLTTDDEYPDYEVYDDSLYLGNGDGYEGSSEYWDVNRNPYKDEKPYYGGPYTQRYRNVYHTVNYKSYYRYEYPKEYDKYYSHRNPGVQNAVNFYQNGGINQHTYYEHSPGVNKKWSFPLNKGYHITIDSSSPYLNYPNAFSIYTDDGKEVLSKGNLGYKPIPYNLQSYWWLIKVGRLKNGKWIIGTGKQGGYVCTVDDKGEANYDSYFQPNYMYSYEYVKNWPQVAENIRKCIGEQ